MTERPNIENAPGLKWKPLKDGWQARWRARDDLVKRGYRPEYQKLWSGTEPTELERELIASQCQDLQAEMLIWGRGGLPDAPKFDKTVGSLIRCYETDPDSTYKKLRYKSRQHSDTLCRLVRDTEWVSPEGVTMTVGETMLADIKARVVLRWYEKWSADGKVAMGHSMVGKLRTLMGFGATILEDEDCERLSSVLHKMRFTMPKARNERLTADQVVLIRNQVRAKWPSMALAQAIQFECMFRQKDVIGEWVPMSEAPVSVVLDGNQKWLRGIQWQEIDQNLVLTHVTSKRQKEIVVDLKLAPMVMEELTLRYGAGFTRADLPSSGPVIVNDRDQIPWYAQEFRRHWRLAANACGIPKTVRNMDSRAGAISEATDAGAELEHVRQAATHSDIGMTQKYSRGSTEKIAGVMEKRTAHRNKAGTS